MEVISTGLLSAHKEHRGLHEEWGVCRVLLAGNSALVVFVLEMAPLYTDYALGARMSSSRRYLSCWTGPLVSESLILLITDH